MKEQRNPAFVRHLLFAAGLLCSLLAILGFLLPLIPGTPFLLLAMACFSRSSERTHRWVLGLPGVGPILEEWERDGSISLRVKIIASITLAAATVYPLFFEGLPTALRWVAGLSCLAILVFLWSRPSRKKS